MKSHISKIILIALSFASFSAFAGNVKIVSFRYIESGANRSPAAELCGRLEVATGKAELVKIVVDPSSKAPGSYYVMAGKDGQFCALVATYTGKAEAFHE